VKNGVPFDVAHALTSWELVTYAVTFGELENGSQEWNWDSMTFNEKRR
jgi:hypothetical protein